MVLVGVCLRDKRRVFDVQESQEIDRAELAINGGRTADPGAQTEVGPKEPWRGWAEGRRRIEGNRESRQWLRLQFQSDEVSLAQFVKHCPAKSGILRGKRAAIDEVSGSGHPQPHCAWWRTAAHSDCRQSAVWSFDETGVDC
jgi:hypothetical protein